jgi:hypothetical protein
LSVAIGPWLAEFHLLDLFVILHRHRGAPIDLADGDEVGLRIVGRAVHSAPPRAGGTKLSGRSKTADDQRALSATRRNERHRKRAGDVQTGHMSPGLVTENAGLQIAGNSSSGPDEVSGEPSLQSSRIISISARRGRNVAASRRDDVPSAALGLAERLFAEITRRRIRRGEFHNVTELEAAIQEWIERRN